MRRPYFEMYRDKAKEWRWRLKAANGRIVAESGEGYKRLGRCEAAIDRLYDLISAPVLVPVRLP